MYFAIELEYGEEGSADFHIKFKHKDLNKMFREVITFHGREEHAQL